MDFPTKVPRADFVGRCCGDYYKAQEREKEHTQVNKEATMKHFKLIWISQESRGQWYILLVRLLLSLYKKCKRQSFHY